MSDDPQRPANRLAQETSPYLLQHARNPVDWHPWGREALERARSEDKPLFLSIGYSACHWCHVMERESFEDPTVAARMNHWFVNVKVDREERPDLDEIYMKAVQAMTGSGGWPMSVFLTPDLEPFFGGTYFPPRRLYGRPSFIEVVESLGQSWRRERETLVKRGRAMAEAIRSEGRARLGAELDPQVLDLSLAALSESFDPEWGGFGGAPKFPHAMDLRLLLRHHLRTGAEAPLRMALESLDRMAEGGIHDQLGGGFHRYSTDERWLVPHFEKMLYDNALLVPAYLEAHLASGAPRFAEVARRACDWALREMVTPEGGFASSQDADSEGEEGRFFAWTIDELRAELGPKPGARAAEWFGATEEGNWEERRNVLWRHEPAETVAERLRVPREELEREMDAARARLFAARGRRERPATDDKVLASWNGLMVSALAQAFQVLDEPRYLDAARRAARYVLERMRRPDGRLLATARRGRAHLDAYLDDHAFIIQGLIDLHESDFDAAWLRAALELAEVVERRFADREHGGHFTTADDHEELLARLKVLHDGALPSGNAVHALNLLRLAELTGRPELAQRAQAAIVCGGTLANRHPSAMSQLLTAVDFLAAGPREIVVAGERDAAPTRAMLRTVRGRFLPQRVVALAAEGADEQLVPLVRARTAPPGAARAYVCRNYACERPAESPAELEQQLRT